MNNQMINKKHTRWTFSLFQENPTWSGLKIIWTWESVKFPSKCKYVFGWDRPAPGISHQSILPVQMWLTISCIIISAGWTVTRLKAHLKQTMIPTVRSHSLLRAPLIWILKQNMGPNYHAECMLGCSTWADGRKARARRCRKWKTDWTWRDVACRK